MRVQLLIFILLLGNFAQSKKVDKKSKIIKSGSKNAKSGTKIDKKPKKGKLVKKPAVAAGVSDGGDSPEKREWLQMWDDARQFIADAFKQDQVGFRRKVWSLFLSAKWASRAWRTKRSSWTGWWLSSCGKVEERTPIIDRCFHCQEVNWRKRVQSWSWNWWFRSHFWSDELGPRYEILPWTRTQKAWIEMGSNDKRDGACFQSVQTRWSPPWTGQTGQGGISREGSTTQTLCHRLWV